MNDASGGWKKPESSWRTREKESLAQGETGTNSKRPEAFIQGVYPTHLVRGHGCYVVDTQGNRYVDFVGSLGACLLGHNHPKVTEAVTTQVRAGISFSLPHFLEVEVAEKIIEMFPQIEKVRFLKTGAEAASAAVRIARASTGLMRVYSEGYHGWHDAFTSLTPPSYGVPKDPNISDKPTNEIYICEPLVLENFESRQAWVKEMRDLHRVTIFDEIITGLKVPKFSVGRMWNIAPDITCLGKGLANGFPLTVVGGRRELMDSDYFVSSTFSGEAVSLAACYATLNTVQALGMDNLWYYANRFQEKFNSICKPIDVKIEGYGTRGMLSCDTLNYHLFMQECCKGGLLFGKAYNYGFAHMETGVEEFTFNVVCDVVERIKNEKVKLEGPPPKFVFKR